MKKKSLSLQKLPEIYKHKKDQLIQLNNQLNQKITKTQKQQNKSIQSDFLQSLFLRRKSKILLTPFEQQNNQTGLDRKSLPKTFREHSSKSTDRIKLNINLDLKSNEKTLIKDVVIENPQKKRITTVLNKQFVSVPSKLATTQSNLIRLSSMSPFIQNKINIQAYRTQKKNEEFYSQIKKEQEKFKNKNKLFLPQKVQTEQKKSIFISYSNNQKVEKTFKQIQEKQITGGILKSTNIKIQSESQIQPKQRNKLVLVRFNDGGQKWIKKQKIIKNYAYHQIDDCEKNEKNISVDQTEQQESKAKETQTSPLKNDINPYLQGQFKKLSKAYMSIQDQPSPQLLQYLYEQLYNNYNLSSKKFFTQYKTKSVHQKSIIKTKQKKYNQISMSVKQKLQNQIYCSYNLSFLKKFHLHKEKYVRMFIKAYTLVSQFKISFYHLKDLYSLNIEGDVFSPFGLNSNIFNNVGKLHLQVNEILQNRKQKLQQQIYRLQSHITFIEQQIISDIEYCMKLSPSLANLTYREDLRSYSTSISVHLGKIIASIIHQNLQNEVREFVNFVQKWTKNEYYFIVKPTNDCIPRSTFYDSLYLVNQPLIQQSYLKKYKKIDKDIKSSKQLKQNSCRLFHAPGLIPVQLTVNKLKKRRYVNIYRFIITSRQLIREFQPQNPQFILKAQKLQFYHFQPRISYTNPGKSLEQIIIKPLQRYFQQITHMESVNGCINGTNIQLTLSSTSEYKKLKALLLQCVQKVERQFVSKYVEYFSLWEIYFMQKSYIQEILVIYKHLGTVNLLKQELINLQKDLQIILSFPNVIEYKFYRLDISLIKEKVTSTINSHMTRILDECSFSITKGLEHGFHEYLQAKNIVQLTQYSSLQEYLRFIELMSERKMQRAINKIAECIVIVEKNVELLTSRSYQLKQSTLKYYLESSSWTRQLRKILLQNRKKVILDPTMFIQSLKQMKNALYLRYHKILKQIIQLMKTTDLKRYSKFNAIAMAIHHQMAELCAIVTKIQKDQKILGLNYLDQNMQVIFEDNKAQSKKQQQKSQQENKQQQCVENPLPQCVENPLPQSQSKQVQVSKQTNKLYLSDLTFFLLEQKFLSKYLELWMFFARFKLQTQMIMERSVLNLEGIELIKLLREGSQLSYKIRHSTLNKKVLHLVEEMNKEISVFSKNGNVFNIILGGSARLRKCVLTYIVEKLDIKSVDVNVVTLREYLKWATESVPLQPVIQLREIDMWMQGIFDRQTAFSQYLRHYQVTKTNHKLGNYAQLSIVKIDNQLITTVEYFRTYLKGEVNKWQQLVQKQSSQNILSKQLLTKGSDYEELLVLRKKVDIFYVFIIRFKQCAQIIPQYSGLYEVLSSILLQYQVKSQYTYLREGERCYDRLKADLVKKSQQIDRFGFLMVFNQKTKVNYTQQLLKLQQCAMVFYQQFFLTHQSKVQPNGVESNGQIQMFDLTPVKQLTFRYLLSLKQSFTVSSQMSIIFTGSQHVNLQLQCQDNNIQYTQNNAFELRLQKLMSIYGEIIFVDKLFPLLQVNNEILKSSINGQLGTINGQLDTINADHPIKSYPSLTITHGLTQHSLYLTITHGLIQHSLYYHTTVNKILHYQFLSFYPLIHSVHFNIKKIFQIYISFNQLLLQTILSSLNLSFYMDLALVWQNKYDLKLFYNLLKQNIQTGYQCKEKQGQPYVKQITLLIKCFQNITKYLVEADQQFTQNYNNQTVKSKKHIAYHLLPKLTLPNASQKYQQCKKWLHKLKKQKQDDFIFFTHQSPLIDYNIFPHIEFKTIDLRQIQTKEDIFIKQLQIKSNQFFIKNYKLSQFYVTLQYPLLKELEIIKSQQKVFFSPNNQILTQFSAETAYQSCIALTLFKYCFQKGKIFVTNVPLNSTTFGKCFAPVHKYEYCPSLKMKVVCRDQQHLLRELKSYYKQKSSRQGYQSHEVYFHVNFSNISILNDLPFHNEIECFIIGQNGANNLINHTSCLQKIMIRQFINTANPQTSPMLRFFGTQNEQHKLIQSHRFKENLKLSYKQKNLMRQMIEVYNKENGYSSQISDQLLYSLTLNHYVAQDLSIVKEAYKVKQFLLKQEIQSKHVDNKSLTKDMNVDNKSLTKDMKDVQRQQLLKKQLQINSVNLYVIPAYMMTIQQVFGSYRQESKQFTINNNDTQKKQTYPFNKATKHIYERGVLQKMILSIKQNQVNQYFRQFLCEGNPYNFQCKQWYVFDLTIQNSQSERITSQLIDSFARQNGFTCLNGQTLYFNFSQKTEHKIIYLLNQKVIQKHTRNFNEILPLPIVQNERSFSPIHYMQKQIQFATIKSLGTSKKLKQKYLNWMGQLFYQDLNLTKQNNKQQQMTLNKNQSSVIKLGLLFNRNVTQLAVKMINIQLNQIRKYFISIGYYEQKELSQKQTTFNIFSSTQLRQKTNLKDSNSSSVEHYYHIQEIQKYLDHVRKTIYKTINQNLQINLRLKKSNQESLQEKLACFNPLILNEDKVYQKLIHSTIFAFFYCLLIKGKDIQQSTKDKIKKNISKANLFQTLSSCFTKQLSKISPNTLYIKSGMQKYYFDIGENEWKEWSYISNSIIDFQSCSPSKVSKTLHISQIIRLNPHLKKPFFKQYHNFLISYEQKVSPKILSYDFHNYFAKIFVLYGIKIVWDLQNLKRIQKESLIQDLIHMKNKYDEKLIGSEVYKNEIGSQQLQINSDNKKLMKCIQDLKIPTKDFIIVNLSKLDCTQMEMYQTLFRYRLKKGERNQFSKMQSNHILFIKDTQQQQQIKDSQENLNGKNGQVPNYFDLLVNHNREILSNSLILRQRFIGIMGLLKNYQDRLLFDRIQRIIKSLPQYKAQSPTNYLIDLFKVHGIMFFWNSNEKQNQKVSISDFEDFNSLKNIMMEIIQYINRINTDEDFFAQQKQNIFNFIINTSTTYHISQEFIALKDENQQHTMNKQQFKENLKKIFNFLIYSQIQQKLIIQIGQILPAKDQKKKEISNENNENCQVTPPFILRYMLKKPKKYINETESISQSPNKKKVPKKSIYLRPSYKDILPFSEELQILNRNSLKADFQLYHMKIIRQLFFFELSTQKYLLVQMGTSLFPQIYAKYLKAYKIYRKSVIEARKKEGKMISANYSEQEIEGMEFDDNYQINEVKVCQKQQALQKQTQTIESLRNKNHSKHYIFVKQRLFNRLKNDSLISIPQKNSHSKQKQKINEESMFLSKSRMSSSNINEISQLGSLNKITESKTNQNIQKQSQELNFVTIIDPSQVDIIIEELISHQNNQNAFNHYFLNDKDHQINKKKRYIIFVPSSKTKESQTSITYKSKNYLPHILENPTSTQINEQDQQKNSKSQLQFFQSNIIFSPSLQLSQLIKFKLKQKFQHILKKLQELFIQKCKKSFQQSKGFKRYIQLAQHKLTEIKTSLLKMRSDFQQKSQTIKQLQTKVSLLEKQLNQNIKNFNDNQKNLQKVNIQNKIIKNKLNFYIGETQFREQNKRLRSQIGSIKQLQKLVISQEYLRSQKNPNLYFIILFSVMGQNSFYAEKYNQFLLPDSKQKQFLKNNRFQLQQSHKKSFLKLVNYGRLSAIIQNESVLTGDTLTEEQLNFLIKFTESFKQLKPIMKKNHSEKLYNENNPFSLIEVCSASIKQIDVIYCDSPLKSMFHKYLLCFFVHKLIRFQLSKSQKQCQQRIAFLQTQISILRRRKQENESIKVSTQTTLDLMKKKYSKSEQQYEGSIENQQQFIKILEKNINVLFQTDIFLKSGIRIKANFKYEYKTMQQSQMMVIKEKNIKIQIGIAENQSLKLLTKELLIPLRYSKVQWFEQKEKQKISNLQIIVFLIGVKQTHQIIIEQSIPTVNLLYQYLKVRLAQELSFSIHFIDTSKDNKNNPSSSLQLISIEKQELKLPKISSTNSPQITFINSVHPELNLECIKLSKRFQQFYHQNLQKDMILNRFSTKIQLINSKRLQSIQKWKIQQTRDILPALETLIQNHKKRYNINKLHNSIKNEKINKVQGENKVIQNEDQKVRILNIKDYFSVFQTIMLKITGSSFLMQNIQQIQSLTQVFSQVFRNILSIFSLNQLQSEYYSKIMGIIYRQLMKEQKYSNNKLTEYQLLSQIFHNTLTKHGHKTNSMNEIPNNQAKDKSLIQFQPQLQQILTMKDLTQSLFLISTQHSFTVQYIHHLGQKNSNQVLHTQIQFDQIPQNQELIVQFIQSHLTHTTKQKWLVCRLYIPESANGFQSKWNKRLQKIKLIKKILKNLSTMQDDPKRIKIIIILNSQIKCSNNEFIDYISQNIQPVYSLNFKNKGISHVFDLIREIYDNKKNDKFEDILRHTIKSIIMYVFGRKEVSMIFSLMADQIIVKNFLLLSDKVQQDIKVFQKKQNEIQSVNPMDLLNLMLQVSSSCQYQSKWYDLLNSLINTVYVNMIESFRLGKKLIISKEIIDQIQTLKNILKTQDVQSQRVSTKKPSLWVKQKIVLKKPLELNHKEDSNKKQVSQSQEYSNPFLKIKVTQSNTNQQLQQRVYYPAEKIEQLEANTSNLLADPYINVVINKAFRNVIMRIMKKRGKKQKALAYKNINEQLYQQEEQLQAQVKQKINQKVNKCDLNQGQIKKEQQSQSQFQSSALTHLFSLLKLPSQPQPQSLVFNNFCQQYFKFSKSNNTKLEDIIVVLNQESLSDNQFQLQFTRTNSFNQAMNLIGSLVDVVKISNPNDKKNKNINSNQSQNVTKNSRKTVQLNITNPLLQQKPNQQHSQTTKLQKLFGHKQDTQKQNKTFTLIPRSDFKIQTYKTEGINFKYIQMPHSTKKYSIIKNNDNPLKQQNQLQTNQIPQSQTLNKLQKLKQQFITMIPVYYQNMKIGVMQMKTNEQLFSSENKKAFPLFLVIN